MQTELKHVDGRIVVSIDVNYKNSWTFADGTKIELARKYDNFNLRYVNPVNAIVVSAENIPEGSEILIHHNCVHETNRVHDYKPLSGKEIASDIKYFSILETEAFAWRDGAEWKPLEGFDFSLRVFRPYKGIIQGVEPTLLKDVLWITTGEYKHNVCCTLKNCDYQLIFQDTNGREGNLIRLRTSENLKEQREAEIVAIHNQYTEQVLNGELIIGLTKSDAKTLKQLV